MNKKTFYITTPIYYPSGNLHIGHLYTTTIAWVMKNYKKKMGYDTLFLTGADEHGQKIEQKAAENNLTPQKYVDAMSLNFINLWSIYKIDYDIFSRTTNKDHIKSVKKIFSDLYKKKHIYLSKYKGLYSIPDEEFISKKNAIKKLDKYYHPQSHHLLENVEEESYFLKLKESIIWLRKYIANNSSFIDPKKVIKELESNFLDVGINDLSITRTSFNWGIEIKENSKHVTYVWLDALSNYITMLGYNSSNTDLYNKFWTNGDEIVHIVGKEITRFHCIYWPIMLHLLGIKQPTRIQSHGWIITGTGKMSKSKNNVINPIDLSKKYDPEIIKYFLVRKLKLDHDGIFNESVLIDNYNSELANTFGNLVARTVAMFSKNFDDLQLHNINSTSKYDLEFNDKIIELFQQYKQNMDLFKIDEAFKCAMALGRYSNNYIDVTMPWKLTDKLDKLMPILYNLFNSVYSMSAMLEIVMPDKIKQIAKIFNIKTFNFEQITNKNKNDKLILNIKQLQIIFPRI